MRPANPVLTQEHAVKLQKCLYCGKHVEKGYYGRWLSGGVCSKECDSAQEKQPKYPGFTETEFMERLGVTEEDLLLAQAEGMDEDH